MKVSKAVNLFLDYHKMNSQKIYGPGLGTRRLFPQDFPTSTSSFGYSVPCGVQ